jgi:4-amino-4-deoxy-L-arabinose transferase-like glycosyltransferase
MSTPKLTLPPAVLVGIGGLVLFCYGIERGELYRNETLRAQLAAEMLRSGQWVVPTLYGEPLLTKPPLQYWLVAAASLPLGQVTETTARLPSVIGALALLVSLFLHLHRPLGSWGAALVALTMPATWLWLEKAPSAELDMMLTAWVGLALIAAWRALTAAEAGVRGPCWAWWTVALLAVALGVLTKWTAWLYFYAALVPFACWRGQGRQLFRPPHLIAVLLGVILVSLWVAGVCRVIGWETACRLILTEAQAKFVASHHGGPPRWLETLLHPAKILAATLPWSLWVLLTLHPRWWRSLDEPCRGVAQALSCWLWPNLVLFTLLPEHGTRHSFPFMPAVGALAGLGWWQVCMGWSDTQVQAWHRRLAWGCLAGWGVLIVAGTVGGMIKLPPGQWWLILGLAGLGLTLVREGWHQLSLPQPWRVVWCLLGLWCLVKVAYVELHIPYRDADRQVRAKAARLARILPAHCTPILCQLKDEGLMFYLGRPLRIRSWDDLAVDSHPRCLLLTDREWARLGHREDWHILTQHALRDSQNDPLFVVTVVRGLPAVRVADRRR